MNELISMFEKHKIVVICRGVYGEALKHTIGALYDGGVRLVEVTFDQADSKAIEKTSAAIRMIKNVYPEMKVGSGTVTCVEHVIATKQAGGDFCLSPDVNVEVIKKTKELGLLSIPGAMTSTEIMSAHHAGADIVKIFPAGWLGIDYIKNVRGPINHVRFLAAAGVTEENFKEFLDAGYCAAGISSRFIDKKIIQEGNFAELTRRAKVFSDIAKQK